MTPPPPPHGRYYFAISFFPILIVAVNDFDVPKKLAGFLPKLYTAGLQRTHFSLKGFSLWVLDSLYASAVAAYVPVWGLRGLLLDDKGLDAGGYWIQSWAAMHIISLGVNARLIFEVRLPSPALLRPPISRSPCPSVPYLALL